MASDNHNHALDEFENFRGFHGSGSSSDRAANSCLCSRDVSPLPERLPSAGAEVSLQGLIKSCRAPQAAWAPLALTRS
jgi:hypothetical protein